ncbi:3-oxoacyl-[acyl-carrier-protein] synthase 2 [Oribacterium asaccharolyticum ACB7]|uniref:3-oxoacyl-[acyl-carrier-protein] synthase 2 n=1 Tax=Oribacterium asaccharolyticum ACB7 TaxID=796944 RepID=G9WRH7_9FIRM|nr:beta-ketoacyl-ACP synthase II [Oribacterium asaccharolyticum]EHL13917.1 3-oxoacyl-[acyl-carrier-protein] synthase 2 [Oribacterium asaccharolyticum ACB7]
MEKRRVVVTGLGTVNPTGNTVEESWKGIREGKVGIGEITAFDSSAFSVHLAGEVKEFHPETVFDKRELKHMARFTQFAMIAAEEAMLDSGISGSLPPEEMGVIVSSGIGGLKTIEEEHTKGEQKGFERVSPFFIPMSISNMAAGEIAIRHKLKGLCICPVTACAGGSNAVGDAFHRIRDGYETAMLCGGTEAAISELGIGGFATMKALSPATEVSRASIPFDKERSGFVMGEGAGILILEEREHALKRGAKIYAEIVGYGANCDAYHITSPAPGGEGAAACMELALKDAGVTAAEIDYINAHGTSTHLNDLGETAAVKHVFKERAYSVPISSTKSMTGHLLGAAGAVEAIFSVLALRDGFIPGTMNYQVKDEELDLDYVPNKGREKELRYTMSNSLGFGGHNACLVFKK